MTTSELSKLARSQLKHVLIALEDDDRDFNLRNVLDPWWCYNRGGVFVGRKRSGGYFDRELNAPCAASKRQLLQDVGSISIAAQNVLDRGVIRNKLTPAEDCLIVDHTIPLRVVEEELRRNSELRTIEDLEAFLRRYFIRSVLTVAEHDHLSVIGLGSEMPKGWRIGASPYMRYAEAGLPGSWTKI